MLSRRLSRGSYYTIHLHLCLSLIPPIVRFGYCFHLCFIYFYHLISESLIPCIMLESDRQRLSSRCALFTVLLMTVVLSPLLGLKFGKWEWNGSNYFLGVRYPLPTLHSAPSAYAMSWWGFLCAHRNKWMSMTQNRTTQLGMTASEEPDENCFRYESMMPSIKRSALWLPCVGRLAVWGERQKHRRTGFFHHQWRTFVELSLSQNCILGMKYPAYAG